MCRRTISFEHLRDPRFAFAINCLSAFFAPWRAAFRDHVEHRFGGMPSGVSEHVEHPKSLLFGALR